MSKAVSIERARLGLDAIEDILADLRDGCMIVMMDDAARENEGDLIMAAEKATPEKVAFFVRHTSGIICLPTTAERLRALELPQMVADNTDSHRTAFTISVDYRHGTTTGISAADRARTIRALSDPGSKPEDFARPGHIFPLRYTAGGVLRRAGHTEASVDLVRLAGLKTPAAIISEVVNDDGSVKRAEELVAFAREHRLRIGTIADLIRYRLAHERTVARVAEQEVATEFGPFRLCAYEDSVDGSLHLALARGRIEPETPVLVRVHVRNTLSDALAVDHPDFGWPLRRALRRIADEETGVMVLLRTPETPVELTARIKALREPELPSVQERDPDLRTYGIGAQILSDLGVRRMRVLSAPKRMHAISGFGLEVVEYVHCD